MQENSEKNSNFVILVVPYFSRLLHTRAECVFTWLNSILHRPSEQGSKIYRDEKAFLHGMVEESAQLFNESERESLQAALSTANCNETHFIIEKILRNVQGHILSLHAPYFTKAILDGSERTFNGKLGICSAKTMLNDLNVGLAVVRSSKNLNEIYRGYPQINNVELVNIIAESGELQTGVSKCIRLVKIRPEFQNYLWHILRTGKMDEQLLELVRQRHQSPQPSASGYGIQSEGTNSVSVTQDWALRIAEVTKHFEKSFNEGWKCQAQEIIELKKLLSQKSNELHQVRGELLTMSYELTGSKYKEIETRKTVKKYKDLYLELKRNSNESVNVIDNNNLNKQKSDALELPHVEIQQPVEVVTQNEATILPTDGQKRPRDEVDEISDQESGGSLANKRNRLSEVVSTAVGGDSVPTTSPLTIFVTQDNCETVKPLRPISPLKTKFNESTSNRIVKRSYFPLDNISQHHQTIIGSMDSKQTNQVINGHVQVPALKVNIVDCENGQLFLIQKISEKGEFFVSNKNVVDEH